MTPELVALALRAVAAGAPVHEYSRMNKTTLMVLVNNHPFWLQKNSLVDAGRLRYQLTRTVVSDNYREGASNG